MINEFTNSLRINLYDFSEKGLSEYELNQFMKDSWPIVYIIKNDRIKEAYIGESTNAILRMKNHLSNKNRQNLDELLVITCNKFNKSAVLDIESLLISYMAADTKFSLQNANAGLVDHNYYQRSHYRELFQAIWKLLLQNEYAINPIERIDNSDLFKYSPYKSLNLDQHQSVISILNFLASNKNNTIFIEGTAGTGKTILAVYLMKLLKTEIHSHHLDESDEMYSDQIRGVIAFQKKNPNPKIALVIAMASLRETLKKIFRSVKGLNGSLVISPSEVSKNEYDILLVDEAHRLRQRKALSNYDWFDKANKRLDFEKGTGTELDWILKQSKHQIFFYDENQSIKPSDIPKNRFKNLKEKHKKTVTLASQMRVKSGLDFVEFTDKLLNAQFTKKDPKFNDQLFDLRIFNNLKDLHSELKEKEKQFGLCRLLSGFSWPWKTKNKNEGIDIEIDGARFKWNVVTKDWINSSNAINEVGCIHTSQGYDLNYVGVIFGKEIKYDSSSNQITIDRKEYFDVKGKQGVSNDVLLKEYIVNIYKTMLLRGIRGAYIYICDDDLRNYFSQFIPVS